MVRLNEMLRRRDEGFTLIELMVVVLIIGILIAIAIPTFLGARGRAEDRAAQASLRNAMTSAKAIYTDNETYLDANVAKLTAGEPSLTFKDQDTDVTPFGSNTISVGDGVAPATASRFVGAAWSKNNKCWYVQDVVSPGSNPGTKWEVDAVTPGACKAVSASVVGSALWSSNIASAGELP